MSQPYSAVSPQRGIIIITATNLVDSILMLRRLVCALSSSSSSSLVLRSTTTSPSYRGFAVAAAGAVVAQRITHDGKHTSKEESLLHAAVRPFFLPPPSKLTWTSFRSLRSPSSIPPSFPPPQPAIPNFINGVFVHSKTRKWISLRNPATQELLGRVPESTQGEVGGRKEEGM